MCFPPWEGQCYRRLVKGNGQVWPPGPNQARSRFWGPGLGKKLAFDQQASNQQPGLGKKSTFGEQASSQQPHNSRTAAAQQQDTTAHSTAQHTAQHTPQHTTAQHSTAQHTTQHSTQP